MKIHLNTNSNPGLLRCLLIIAMAPALLAGCDQQTSDSATQGSATQDEIQGETQDVAPEEMASPTQIADYAAQAKTLQQQMELELKEHATEADLATMAQSAADLAAAMPNPGLAVGATAPDFSLPNSVNQTIILSEMLKTGPVVLVFYRGDWCPFCNLHLHTLRSIVPDLKAYNANIVAITPQKPDESAKTLAEKGFPFEVLSDLDDSVMQAYNLFFELDAQLLAVYEKFEIDLEVYNGEGRTGLPVPATFIIDQQGVIQAAQVDMDYKKRMEPADVLAAIEKISG